MWPMTTNPSLESAWLALKVQVGRGLTDEYQRLMR